MEGLYPNHCGLKPHACRLSAWWHHLHVQQNHHIWGDAKLCHKFWRKVCSSISQKFMREVISKHNFIQKHLGDDSSFDWKQGYSFNIPCEEVTDNKNVSLSQIFDWKWTHTVCSNNFQWLRDGDGRKRSFWVVNIFFLLGIENTFDPALPKVEDLRPS